jgi:hypothetical protein
MAAISGIGSLWRQRISNRSSMKPRRVATINERREER